MGAVLIVDDRHDVLELNRILLEAEGYEAEGCSYAEATPERLRLGAPRVLLLDLVPGAEAPWTLLQRLRREDRIDVELGAAASSLREPRVDGGRRRFPTARSETCAEQVA